MRSKVKIACIGAGYFAQFHVEGWCRQSDVELVAICDRDHEKARVLAARYEIARTYTEVDRMLDEQNLTFVDIITPPPSHATLIKKLCAAGIHIICQKPFTSSIEEARRMVALAESSAVELYVHENFRFQPWYRAIKSVKDQGLIGDRLHNVEIKLRTGDGWGPDAYLDRQPYFRTMPRLFMYETGIHYIDTLRYLHGEIVEVYAKLFTYNQHIAGEDAALVLCTFADGATAVINANRYNESDTTDPRYTFGKTTIEGNAGAMYLESDSTLHLKQLGKERSIIDYERSNKNFAGDCVYHTQRAMMEAYQSDSAFETNGAAYLRNMEILEAVYESFKKNAPIRV